MPDDVATAEADAWVKAVLGVDPADYRGQPKAPEPGTSPGTNSGTSPRGKPVAMGAADPKSPLSQAAHDPKVWTRSVGKSLTRQGPANPGARIQASVPAETTACKSKDGREVGVGKGKDGRFMITHPAPPIETITFSGGGGKGAALPGAIKALAESGVLKGAKNIHGASVGSMTAALVAAGGTPEDFQKFGAETDWGSTIFGDLKYTGTAVDAVVGATPLGFVIDNPLTHVKVAGNKLETLVRTGMKSAVGKQIAAFAHASMQAGTQPDKATMATLETMTVKFAGKDGPTFMDLRVLSKIIPDIKEVVITGTLVAMKGKPKKGEKPPGMKEQKPQSVVFSADTQPKLEVALAVHASAALPPLFEPVDIPLASGEIGRFIDGGVLNNTPTQESIGGDRDVDPVPEKGSMTFLFQNEDSEQVLQGTATAGSSSVKGKMGRMVQDAIAGAEFGAASYDTNRGLADRPEDVVMVPLKFTDAKGKKKDFSGLVGGTLKFDVAKDDRMMLEGLTEKATAAHIAKRKEKETRSFASEGEMMACAPRADLVAMAESKYPGAQDALTFRDEVDKAVAELGKRAKAGATPDDPDVQKILAAVDAMANGDDDRIGYVGRTMNRSGALDAFLKKAGGKTGGPKGDGLAAGMAVAAVLAARKTAHVILQQVVYPKMVREGPDGPMGALLQQMDVNLRDARSSADINQVLRRGIEYFSKRKDPGGVLGHKDFALALTKRLQKDG